MKYLIVIEKTETGASQQETEANMKEAIAFHLEGLKAEGLEIPQPSSSSAYVVIAA